MDTLWLTGFILLFAGVAMFVVAALRSARLSERDWFEGPPDAATRQEPRPPETEPQAGDGTWNVPATVAHPFASQHLLIPITVSEAAMIVSCFEQLYTADWPLKQGDGRQMPNVKLAAFFYDARNIVTRNKPTAVQVYFAQRRDVFAFARDADLPWLTDRLLVAQGGYDRLVSQVVPPYPAIVDSQG